MHGIGILQLIAAHATSVVMAGLFGFFGILATRGALRVMLGERGFRRVSSAVQSALVVCSVTALLLAPTVRATEVRDWIAGVRPAPWPARPVLWYLGMNETLAGRIVAETPVVLPPRFSFLPFPKQQDEAARAAYRRLLPRFGALARAAWLSVPVMAFFGLATFLWNNRRLPEQSTSARAGSFVRVGLRQMAERLTHRNPEAQAGFFFTLQTLIRSAPHRTIVAIGVAAGFTHLLMTLAATGVRPREIQATPLGWFGIAIMMLAALLVGFRYAVTVPPEVRSNWTIRMAWLGDERGYLAGAKRAGLVALVALPLLVLLPLHVAMFGLVTAVVHSAYAVDVRRRRTRWPVHQLPAVPFRLQLCARRESEAALACGPVEPSVRHLRVRLRGTLGAADSDADGGAWLPPLSPSSFWSKLSIGRGGARGGR